ncbi:hypothetical protein MAXJ12_30437 [Mesorhizobium alhagi CCNWXJ12-2]|uniref:DUF982 domain-containing protein n=1 Tax=Mesorhizobium alhagi CCNWXJ12-2 TaxID=1107882 RepID=H0I0V0_9HYPH|nr:DUF982 domain-containing protein [Mesorhizobium alhagi]EHK53369.1 hypothetical protein MAXJ12_30437 [Mesorhizobium alhagi CCNWXJ12-2]
MARLDDRPFNEFVTVKAPRGQRQNISSARQAAEWLLFRWPKEIDTAKPARHAKPVWRSWKGSARRQLHARLFAKRPRKPAF